MKKRLLTKWPNVILKNQKKKESTKIKTFFFKEKGRLLRAVYVSLEEKLHRGRKKHASKNIMTLIQNVMKISIRCTNKFPPFHKSYKNSWFCWDSLNYSGENLEPIWQCYHAGYRNTIFFLNLIFLKTFHLSNVNCLE